MSTVEIRPRRGGAPPSDEVASRTNLTRAQYLMWLGQAIEPDIPLYNMIQTFHFAGQVDQAAFGRAWQAVIDASDALRTTIAVVEGVPQRKVHERMSAPVEVVDLRTADRPAAAFDSWIERRKVRPLGLADRLWDVALVLLGDDECVWYLCQHHLITDGQSFSVVYRAVAERYQLDLEGRLDEASPLPPYEDHVRHEREVRTSSGWSRAAEHWASRASSPPEPTELYGRSAAGPSARTDRVVLDLGPERSERVRSLAQQPELATLSEELSLFTIWATVLFTTLHRIGNRRELRVGTPFLGRPTTASRNTIGLFIEIGVLDVAVADDDTFTSLARRVHREVIQGIRHAKPGVSTAALNRSYDVLLNSVTSRFEPFAGIPVTTDWIHTGYGDRDHVLRLQVSDFDDTGAFRLHFDVNTETVGSCQRRWLLEHFERVLDRMLEDHTAPIGGFDLLSADDRRHQVTNFNATDADYPHDLTVVDLFERQAATTPAAVASEDRTRRVTYRELDEEANRIAHLLRAEGVAAGGLVAICAHRSVTALAAILGVLKAGGAYVPIDPAYPDRRRRLMIDDADPVVVLTAGVEVDHPARKIMNLDTTRLGDHPAGPVEHVGRPELAYVIYTSGSTGSPKGTMIAHRGLVNYIWWAKDQYLAGTPRDFALYSSLAFDLTVTSIFVPLASGGRVVVYEESADRTGLEVLDVFAEDRVDVVKLTPAHLALLRDHGFACDRIRTLIVGGENLRTELARDISSRFDDAVTIFNEYGPTEAVVGCMLHRFDPKLDTGASVPIGRPAANARIHVVDRYQQPVPPGVTGEMVVSSDGVALGYLGRPDLTAERFGEDPNRPGARWYRTGDLARWGTDGQLEFLGRDDHQVKIRGARVELGEIEAALLAHPQIEAAVLDVVTLEDDSSDTASHCVTCGLPSNYPRSEFDDRGECSDCRAFARHADDVARYFGTPDDLHRILADIKVRAADAPVDCLVLVSGGKDSTYMLYRLVRDFGVRPLVFTLDNGYISKDALDNVRSACADLDVELHIGSTPHMNAIFADSLERHANVCDGCFKTIYTLATNLARERGIDTIVTGLARGQLFETRLADTFAAREFDPEAIDALVLDARRAYHQIDDAVTRLLDTRVFRDDSMFEDLTYVDFYRYIDVGLDEVYRYLVDETAWNRPPDTGRSTNCLINDVGIHIHTTTRGYHNYALPYSWDVRLGHKRREAAMTELDDDIDLARVRGILDEIGYPHPISNSRSGRRLAGYYVARDSVTSADVRAHLAAELPDFMVPTYLVAIDEIPLTVNGKVDRAALPDRGLARPELATTFVAPRTEAEAALTEAWETVLRIPDIGIHDNFFDLGGDSISSIQIVAEARHRGLTLSAGDLFTHQTIADLAREVDLKDHGEPGRVGPRSDHRTALGQELYEAVTARLDPLGGWRSVEDVYPLTPTQLGMLYHCLQDPESATYFGQGTGTLDGNVDAEALQRAWQVVCRRHPATRVRLLWRGLETPVQVVQRDTELPWEVHDWRGRPATEADAALEALLAEQRRAGFDLDGAALMAFHIVHTDDTSHFVWNSHHAVLDGWSAHVLHREAVDEYNAIITDRSRAAPVPARPFRDHVAWLASQDREAALTWWRDRLTGFDAATAIPVLGEPTGERSEHRSLVRDLGPDLSSRLASFAREQRLTLSTLATGAWGLVLSRYSSSDDVVFGSTVSGREDGIAGVEDMVGMLIATLPTRLRVDDSAPVGDWLRAVQLDAADARRHGHVGLADIQRETDVPAGRALFDSIVVVENYPATDFDDTDVLRASPLEIGAPSNFPLALLIHPGESLRIEAVYDGVRLDEAVVERLTGHVEHVLGAFAHDGDGLLSEIATVGAAEREQLVNWGRGPDAPPAEALVTDLIASRAVASPDTVALSGPDGELTYAELVGRARRIARGLHELGAGPGQRVGLMAEGRTGTIIGLLAILEAGATYVPLDPAVPASRQAQIVKTSALSVVLSDGLAALDGIDVSVVDLVTFPYDEYDDGSLAVGPGPDDVAYVIHTSGSTGAPKGVIVTHANLAHSTTTRFEFYQEPVESFLLLSPMAFDSSMVGIFWTLCSGGTLVVPSFDRRLDVHHLSELIRLQGITHLLALPSLYEVLLDQADPTSLASLRVVIVAGEPCPASLVERHLTDRPDVGLYNEYGPTEGTVWSHAGRLDERVRTGGVHIGRPIPNSWCLVLDRAGHPAPVGIPGELVLGGPGIARGYLGASEANADPFGPPPAWLEATTDERVYRTGDLVRWRSDGCLDFVGRVDHQVKVRGYRIELADVEAALLDEPAVSAAAAQVVDADDNRRRRLVAWYCASPELDEPALRARLTGRLPDYMVPAVLVRLDEMPRTTTGKLNRAALPLPITDARRPDRSDSPVDEVESEVLAVWQRVLGCDDIGVHDNFFDLGGNSLDAMRVFARIERQSGRELPLSTLFAAPTVAGLADALRTEADPRASTAETGAVEQRSNALVAIKPSGAKRPFFYVAPHEVSVLELGKIAKHFDTDRPFYGLQASGLEAGEAVHHTVEEIAADFVEAVIHHTPAGPYLIGGHCDGSWFAHEMAVQLADRGETVAYLGFADLPPPAFEQPPMSRLARVVERMRYFRREGRLWHAIRWQLKLKAENAFLLRFGGPAARRVRRVRLASQEALGSYRFRQDHRAPVHLVRSTELAGLMDEIEFYDELQAGPNEVVVTDITSTHARLLREPETAELAEMIGRRLDEVDPG